MVLEDHVKRKRRLISPFLASMGDTYSPYSWAHQITPELFWITILLRDHGIHKGVEIARALGEIAANVTDKEPKPLFALLSSFSGLSADERCKIIQELGDETLNSLRDSLAPVSNIWPSHPLSFLADPMNQSKTDCLEGFTQIFEDMFDRYCRNATLTIATAVYLGCDQGKIVLAPKVAEKCQSAFKDIEDYPSTEEAKSAGAFFRAMAPMFLMGSDDTDPPEISRWKEYFWGEISSLACIIHEAA